MDKKQNQFDDNKELPLSTAECDYGFGNDELSDEAVAYYVIREVEGTLTTAEIEAFKSHKSSCFSCRDTYSRVKTVIALLKGEDVKPSPGPPVSVSGAATGN
jgi:hypothetical protein